MVCLSAVPPVRTDNRDKGTTNLAQFQPSSKNFQIHSFLKPLKAINEYRNAEIKSR